MNSMPTAGPSSYRWQDHVIAPQHSATGLVATAAIVLLVGAAVMFSVAGPTPPPAPAVDPAAHAATEQTPPLVQLAKRPILPHVRETRL